MVEIISGPDLNKNKCQVRILGKNFFRSSYLQKKNLVLNIGQQIALIHDKRYLRMDLTKNKFPSNLGKIVYFVIPTSKKKFNFPCRQKKCLGSDSAKTFQVVVLDLSKKIPRYISRKNLFALNLSAKKKKKKNLIQIWARKFWSSPW